MAGFVLAKPSLYNLAGKSARFILKYAPKFMIYSKLNAWGKARDLPEVKNENFDEWYKKRNKNG